MPTWTGNGRVTPDAVDVEVLEEVDNGVEEDEMLADDVLVELLGALTQI